MCIMHIYTKNDSIMNNDFVKITILCLKNGKVMIDDQLVSTNIYIDNGKISLISDKKIEASQTINCTNLVILPGVIDSQVHFREPGLEGKETLILWYVSCCCWRCDFNL